MAETAIQKETEFQTYLKGHPEFATELFKVVSHLYEEPVKEDQVKE